MLAREYSKGKEIIDLWKFTCKIQKRYHLTCRFCIIYLFVGMQHHLNAVNKENINFLDVDFSYDIILIRN